MGYIDNVRAIGRSEERFIYFGAELPFEDRNAGGLADVLVEAMANVANYMNKHGCTHVLELNLHQTAVPGRMSHYVCLAAVVA